MIKRNFFLFLLLYCGISAPAQLKWPAITQSMKPWTRWWWEGSAVNKTDLTWNLEQYQKAGLGGVEITPIYGVHGYENQFIDFLSPKWMQMLVHTLNESKRLGLGVDLANATGWPFGGPWVKDEDASKTIYCKRWGIRGGDKLATIIEYKQEPLVRTANNKGAAIDSILQPPSANRNLQSLALDQIQYAAKLPLKALIAYGPDNTMIDLSNKLNGAGELDWTAPAGGDWSVYALFEGLHGKMVERAAPGGEGYAIDHFSAPAARHYFQKFDDAFKGYDLSYLRGFFNDSYEVDDARGEANWTPGFLDEFKKRKGYDLLQYLPALFGADKDSIQNNRVIYDYRSVIDELILENFTKEWKKWGSSKGKILRNQSHGSPANTLDLYSVVDIPETEGTDILRFKFATSAANVTGKKLVSSESVTWLNEHFLSSWGDVKKAIDLYFLGGVNHIFYHGSAYSPKDAPWPGWLFYAAVHFQSTNPQWKDFHVLNEYIARVQSFLQSSKPDNDVLLYYPIADRYSQKGSYTGPLLQHFDGMERNFVNTDFEHVSKWMLDNGYSFDFFSDRQMENFTVVGNKIVTGGNNYKAILFPANKLLPAATIKKLLELVHSGAKILFYKDLPNDVPGFSGLKEGKEQLDALRADAGDLYKYWLKEKHGDDSTLVMMLTRDKGVFYIGNAVQGLMDKALVRQEPLVKHGLKFNRRKNAEGEVYFIVNTGDQPFEDWVNLQTSAKTAAIFNPITGKLGMAAIQKSEGNATIQIKLQLQPFESVIVQTYDVAKPGNTFPYIANTGARREIKGNWTIEFLSGGPTLPAKTTIGELSSWAELKSPGMSDFSGTAKYSINFEKPADNRASYMLDLGQVHETAEVILNGKKIATLIGPNFECEIPASSLTQNNKLEIIVANLMANRIAYMDRNNIPWKIFYNTNMPARRRENAKNGLFDASGWKPLPSGLIGPVTITPVIIYKNQETRNK